jgi:hypothetical protein
MADTALQTVYREEFIAGFAVRQSVLRDSCKPQHQIKGNSAVFLISNSPGNVATTRGAGGLIPARTDDLTQTTLTLLEKHDLSRKSGFNIFAGQGDQRAIMQMESMGVINRDIDSAILTELATGTLDTGATATVLTLNKIMQAWVGLLAGGVPNDGQIYAVITPAAFAYLLQMPNFASADYVVTKPFMDPAAPQMLLPNGSSFTTGSGFFRWMQINWLVHPSLSGVSTSSATMFMYHRDAIGHGANVAGVDSRIGYHEEQDYSWARTSLYHAPKLLQNTGVCVIKHDDSAFTIS